MAASVAKPRASLEKAAAPERVTPVAPHSATRESHKHARLRGAWLPREFHPQEGLAARWVAPLGPSCLPRRIISRLLLMAHESISRVESLGLTEPPAVALIGWGGLGACAGSLGVQFLQDWAGNGLGAAGRGSFASWRLRGLLWTERGDRRPQVVVRLSLSCLS